MTIERLTRIGYWKRDLFDDRFALPHELTGSSDPARKAELLAHLRAGTSFLVWRAETECRICDAPTGWAELTDGVLAWPEGLAHYVEVHDVLLPSWVTVGPTGVDLTRVDDEMRPLPEIEDEAWIRWCEVHRSHAFDDRLRTARTVALARARLAISRVVDRYEAGGSSAAVLCGFDRQLRPRPPGQDACRRSCGRRAMVDHADCLRCFVEPRVEPMARAAARQAVGYRDVVAPGWDPAALEADDAPWSWERE